MSLPKITLPLVEFTVPSTQAKQLIRPMTVKEEKILLRAKAGSAPNEIFLAIIQVLNNCANALDVASLTLFDVEYLFIKLRSISVGNEVEIIFTDTEDNNKAHKLKINLDEIEILWPKVKTSIINITDKTGITVRYPKADLYYSDAFAKEETTEAELFDSLVANCLVNYFDSEDNSLFDFTKASSAEKSEFIESLDVKTYGKLKEFINESPTVYHQVKYTDSKGTEKTLTLSSLTDFFTL